MKSWACSNCAPEPTAEFQIDDDAKGCSQRSRHGAAAAADADDADDDAADADAADAADDADAADAADATNDRSSFGRASAMTAKRLASFGQKSASARSAGFLDLSTRRWCA